jgi:chromosome segregation ATPase
VAELANGNANTEHASPREQSPSVMTQPLYQHEHPFAIDGSPLDGGGGGGGWTSAPKAQPGKSGRVIEKLMAENDRLKRELKLETLKREDEQKRGEMARQANGNLESAYENLVHQQNIDKTALARRDRKIEDLKSDLDRERSGRIRAEETLLQIQTESDAFVQQLRNQLNVETEKEKKATNQYEMLSMQWKSMNDRYTSQVSSLQQALSKLQQQRADDEAKLSRLELVLEQQRHEKAKIDYTVEETRRQFDEYVLETDRNVRGWKESAERNEAENERLVQETLEVVGQMRYVMAVQKNFRHDV